VSPAAYTPETASSFPLRLGQAGRPLHVSEAGALNVAIAWVSACAWPSHSGAHLALRLAQFLIDHVATAPRSAGTGQWRIAMPAGELQVRAPLDAQEIDIRSSTGSIYWEGLSELLRVGSGQRAATGCLKTTVYAGALRL
jgi:predicted secreted hydrolase